MDPKEAEALGVRLERLERDNRYLRWIGAGLFLGLTALIAAGPGTLMSRSRMTAGRFELRDPRGRVRASLGFNDEGAPALRFLDEDGRDQIAMVAEEQSASVELFQHGRTRLAMLASDDGSSTLQLLNPRNNVPSSIYMWPDGVSGLFLSGQELPIHLATTRNGPARLSLLNRDFQELGAFQLSPEGRLDWRVIATSSVAGAESRIVSGRTISVDQAGL